MKLDRKILFEHVETYWRPRIQADGGEVRFVSFKDNVLVLKMQGECSRCPITETCLKQYLTADIRKRFHQEVELKLVVEKPYFWNN